MISIHDVHPGLIEYAGVRLSITIMTCARRQQSELPLTMARLAGYPFRVAIDEDMAGVWACARAAWSTREAHATHHLVLQDDVDVCPHFPLAMAKIASYAPRAAIYPFSPRKSVTKALNAGAHYYREAGLAWGQASMRPVADINLALQWLDRFIAPDLRWDDSRWSIWNYAAGNPVLYTAPHLVQHRSTALSTVGHTSKAVNRVSHAYIGHDGDPMALDWQQGVDAPLNAGGSWAGVRKDYLNYRTVDAPPWEAL